MQTLKSGGGSGMGWEDPSYRPFDDVHHNLYRRDTDTTIQNEKLQRHSSEYSEKSMARVHTLPAGMVDNNTHSVLSYYQDPALTDGLQEGGGGYRGF
jgi:hypothetical protein